MKYFGAVLAAGLLLPGCSTVETSLSTRPTLERTEQQTALEGIAYSLPMLQYQVDVAYKVVSCPGGVEAGKPTTLRLNVEPTASAEYPAGESYTVDYRALSSPLKITDFSIEEHEKSRTLKAINASADDRSLEVIKSLAEVGIAAASLATGNPAGVVAVAAAQGEGDAAGRVAGDILLLATRTMHSLKCTKTATDALAAQKLAQGQVTTETANLDTVRSKVEDILIAARLEMETKEDRVALVQHLRDQAAVSARLTTAQENLKKADKVLSFLDSVRWPSTYTVTAGSLGSTDAASAWAHELFERDAEVELIDPEFVRAEMAKLRPGPSRFGMITAEIHEQVNLKLISALGIQRESPKDFCGQGASVFSCVTKKAGVYASLVPEGPLPSQECSGVRDSIGEQCLATSSHSVALNAPHKGIFIRQPVRARLILCEANSPCSAGQKPLLVSKWDTAPQLGQLRFVPLKNSAFQNNALSITLREDGSIAKFQYAEKAAIAAGMAAAAANVATKANDFDEKREKERKQAIADARAEIAYARAQTAFERTEAAAIRNEAAAVRGDEIAQIQYEIDKLTKQKALLEARFPKAGEDPVVAKEFTNETLRIQAVVAQLQARLAQLEAERALAKASSS